MLQLQVPARRRSPPKPSSRLTRGAQPRAERVCRWSNQCAVLELLGEEPGQRRIAGRRSTGARPRPRRPRAPAARATPAGTERRGGGTPAARQIDASSSATGRGSPLDTTSAWPSSSSAAVDGGDQRVGGVGDVGGVDQRGPGADDEQPPGPGPLDDPADQLGVAGAPHQVRADGDDRGPPVRRNRRRARSARPPPCCGRSGPRARVRVGRPGAGPDQRRAGVRDRRRRDVHEPGHARRRGRPPARCGCRRRWCGRSPATDRRCRPWRPGGRRRRAPRRRRRRRPASAMSASTSRCGRPDGRRCSSVTVVAAGGQRVGDGARRASRWPR